MIKHVVMWKLKDFENDAERMKDSLESLEGEIDELKAIEVGINFNDSARAYDIVLITEFEDEAGLESYQKDPAHLEVVEFVKSVTNEVAAVDYKI